MSEAQSSESRIEAEEPSIEVREEEIEVVDLVGRRQRRSSKRVVKPGQDDVALIFEHLGIHGIKQYFIEQAQEKQNEGKSWKDFLHVAQKHLDGSGRDWVYLYLASMDQDVLEAFIRGNVAAMWYKSQAFRGKVNRFHKLQDWPQIYTAVSCREEATQSTQQDVARFEEEAGWGPSVDEILMVLQTMGEYLDSDCRDQRMLDAVDKAYPELDEKLSPRLWGRRYLASEAGIRKMQGWVKCTERRFQRLAASMDEDDRALAQEWTLSEVGFGERGFRRARQHERHESTNYLFGLYTAVLEHNFPGAYTIKTFAVMDVLEVEHANFCEVLGSLIGGTYAIYGGLGLNPSLAGGLPLGDGKKSLGRPGMATLWDAARDAAVNKSAFERTAHFEKEKIKRAKETFEPALNTDLEALKRQCHENELAIAEKSAELSRLREKAEERKQSRADLEAALDEILKG